jgi:hypothetical protein
MQHPPGIEQVTIDEIRGRPDLFAEPYRRPSLSFDLTS